jgi:hypothetical protein
MNCELNDVAVEAPLATSTVARLNRRPLQTANLAIHADKLDAPLPDAVRGVPSMMSERERMMLVALAQHEYRGAGVIMDAGIFCGASTVSFGTGLGANPDYAKFVARWKKPIRSYEYGVVNPGMIPFFERHGVVGDWTVGGSFESYLRNNIKPFSRLVKLRIGDISLAEWSGEPIELMFLDVLKSPAVQLSVMHEFMPSLMVGGLLVQQDYFIDGVPFVKLMQELLSDHFEYLGEVQSSALFRLVRPLGAARFQTDPLASLTLTEKLALLDRARDRSTDPARRLMCDLGKVRFLVSVGEREMARAVLDALPGIYPECLGPAQLPRIAMAVRAATNRVRSASDRTESA